MMEDSRMEGEKAGWEEGEKEGWKKGETAGIRIFIQSNRDDGVADSVIADKLQKYYVMSAEDARKALETAENK